MQTKSQNLGVYNKPVPAQALTVILEIYSTSLSFSAAFVRMSGSKTEAGLKYIGVHNRPALISSRSEHSRGSVQPAG